MFLLKVVSVKQFPYNQYAIAPYLMTGKALEQYIAVSFAGGVKPLI